MVFITVLTWIGYRRLDHVLPWPVVCLVALVLVFGGSVLLTSVLARTPLSVVLTGRRRQRWSTWLPEPWRRWPVSEEELAVETAVSSPIDPDPAGR